MWDGDEKIHLPRTKTKKSFYITSFKGELCYIAPGLVYSLDKETHKFIQIKQKPKIAGKMDRVITSPCGASTLHLPKDEPFLFYHSNSNNGELFVIPFPKRIYMSQHKTKNNNDEQEPENQYIYDKTSSICYLKIPSGEDLLITNPQFMQNNTTSSFYKPSKFTTKNVTGFAISENRNSIVIAYKNHLYVWQQMRDQIIGTGFWTDLSSNQELKINTNAITMSEKTYGKSNHGLMKPQQIFTLENPNFAPNIPINSEIAYQDMCVFNNPDEGVGVCCLTMLLPPYRPFDRLYIFNSIATFDKQDNGKYSFQHVDTTMPIIEGIGAPCVWWSVDCRIFVLVVSRSLMIMTRHLRLIKILPLTSIFTTVKTFSKANKSANDNENDLDEPLVADVSWSCQGEFFVLTSVHGQVGLVTRCGKSLKHEICALEAFNIKSGGPLLVTADSVVPTLFNIYSPDSLILRRFVVNPKRIPRDLFSLMSLHFPQTSASKLWDLTNEAILKNGISDKLSLVRLLYCTDLFRLFPYFSPLRSILIPLFDEGTMKALKTGKDDIFCYFAVRCIFRLTGYETKSCSLIHQRLSRSKNQKDRVLYKILDDELNKRDCRITKETVPQCIKIYKETLPKDYENMGIIKTNSYDARNANLIPLVDSVINILYHDDFSELDSINCNLIVFAELLIHLDQPGKAMIVSKHQSIEIDPPQFFIKIVSHYANDAANLYVSLLQCIKASPENECEFRAICVRAILNILKQSLSNSIQKWKLTNGKEKEKVSRLANLEKELQIVIPNNKQQLTDFAVIFSIALCAAGFNYCSNYVGQKSTQIPENLRTAIRHLFKLLWFIQWRHIAVSAPSTEDVNADALLRLLAFPDFVNLTAVKSQLESFAPYSKEIFNVYIRDRPIIEQDPLYPDFLKHCHSKLNLSLLSKVSTTVISMNNIGENIPYSGVLIAAIVSHLVPWLRCGITRALVNFSCNEFIPKKLIEFEDYKLPSLLSQNEEEEEYSMSDSYSDYSSSYSEGEFKGDTNGKVIVKQADLNQIQSSSSSDKKPKIIIKNKKITKMKKIRKKKKKVDSKYLPLISPNNVPYNVNQPQPQQQPQNVVVPLPIYYPVLESKNIHIEQDKEPSESFCPIWNFSPDDFQTEKVEEEDKTEIVEEEEEIDDEQEKVPPKPVFIVQFTEPVFDLKPSRKTVETQFEPPPSKKIKPLVKIVPRKQFVPPKKEEPLQLSISSSESELYIPTSIPKGKPVNNPFPLDDGLHMKIDNLIDDIDKIPEPSKLPPKPTYVPVDRNVVIPSIEDFEPDRSKYEIDPDAFNFKKKKKSRKIQKIQTFQINEEIQALTINQKTQNKDQNGKWKPELQQNANRMAVPAKEIPTEQFQRDKSNQRTTLTIKEIDDE